nr:hypothetical protein [Tanacetum cinerariifolium]
IYEDTIPQYFVVSHIITLQRLLSVLIILEDPISKFSTSGIRAWPSPTIESTSAEGQNKQSTTAENGESTDSILSKPAVKFVKAGNRPEERPTTNKAEFVKAAERPTTDKVKTAKKPAVRYAEMYRRTSKRHVNTARPKAMINRRNRVNDVQESACWVWKSVKPNSASIILKRYEYVDVRGRSSNVFPLPKEVPTARRKFPLPEEVPTARRKFPLPEEVPTGSAK